MGKQEFLIDTNVAIEYIGEVLPEKALTMLDEIFNGHFYISVINKIELLGFAGITEFEEQKFKELIKAAFVLDLDEDIVNTTIKIRRSHKTKLPDAIIAATALVNEFTMVSRNISDFKGIEGLHIINPWDV